MKKSLSHLPKHKQDELKLIEVGRETIEYEVFRKG
jgi:hypothetical protein